MLLLLLYQAFCQTVECEGFYLIVYMMEICAIDISRRPKHGELPRKHDLFLNAQRQCMLRDRMRNNITNK